MNITVNIWNIQNWVLVIVFKEKRFYSMYNYISFYFFSQNSKGSENINDFLLNELFMYF